MRHVAANDAGRGQTFARSTFCERATPTGREGAQRRQIEPLAAAAPQRRRHAVRHTRVHAAFTGARASGHRAKRSGDLCKHQVDVAACRAVATIMMALSIALEAHQTGPARNQGRTELRTISQGGFRAMSERYPPMSDSGTRAGRLASSRLKHSQRRLALRSETS